MPDKTRTKKRPSAKNITIYILMAVTGVLITATGLYFRQNFLLILPLYNSLVIGMLQTRVNRYSTLYGSINSLIYGGVYIYFQLYGAAFSALLFSFPIQLLTFIRWNKHKSGSSTVLRKMSTKQRILLPIGFAVSSLVLWIVLPLLGSDYAFLDSVTTMLGIIIYFLTMFAYIEYTVFMLINCALTVVLYITMLKTDPDIATHLIFSVYSFICVFFSVFAARKLYREQQKSKQTDNQT